MFLKRIFKFMINTAPPASNSIYDREKWFKYNNFTQLFSKWQRGLSGWRDDDDDNGGGGVGHDAGSNPMVWDPLKYDSFSLLHNFLFFEVLFFNHSFSLCLVSLYFYCWPSATSPDFCDNIFSSLEFSENCFCDCRFRVRQVSCWTSGSRWSADRKCKSRRQPAQAKTDADGHSRWWNVRIVMHLWKTSWHFRYPRSYAASPSRPCNEIEDVWLALIILVDWLKRNTPSYRSSKEQTLRFGSLKLCLWTRHYERTVTTERRVFSASCR